MTTASAQAGLAEAGVAEGREAAPYQFGLPQRLSDEKIALYHEAAQQIALDAEIAISEWVPGCSVEADPVAEIDANTGLFGSDLDRWARSRTTTSCPSRSQAWPAARSPPNSSSRLRWSAAPLADRPERRSSLRPLTSIEVRVFDLIGTAVLNAACRTLLIEGVGLERSRGDGFSASDDEKPNDLIAFGLGVEVAGERRSIVLGFDMAALQRFSDVVDSRLTGRRQATPVKPSPLVASALHPVPLHLAVEVGRAELTAREVVELRSGDVIRTRVPVDADLVASAGDTDLFEVRLGQRGNKLVAEIVSPIAREADR